MSENESNDLNNSSEKEERLELQTNDQNSENIAEKQEQYRNIINNTQQYNGPTNSTEEYIWRIGFGRRLIAYIIDNIFIGNLFIIAVILTGIADDMTEFLGNTSDFNAIMNRMNEINDFVVTRITPLTLAITFLYYSTEIIFAQSLGKILLGIVIGTDNKKFASYKQLFFRFLIKHIPTIFSLLFLITSLEFMNAMSSILSIIFIIGCFVVLSIKRQAFHDMIAKTSVYFKDELIQFKENKLQNDEN